MLLILLIHRTIVRHYKLSVRCIYIKLQHPRDIAFHHKMILLTSRARTVASHLYNIIWIKPFYVTNINVFVGIKFILALVPESGPFDLTQEVIVLSSISLHKSFIRMQRKKNRRVVVGEENDDHYLKAFEKRERATVTKHSCLGHLSALQLVGYYSIPFHLFQLRVSKAHFYHRYVPTVL